VPSGAGQGRVTGGQCCSPLVFAETLLLGLMLGAVLLGAHFFFFGGTGA
jgi:hypothetical protein